MNVATIGKRYEIQQLLNRGSFGAVYSGRHIRTGEPVAIKFESTDSCLKHETAIIQYLHNLGVRQITQILWFGKFDRFYALVMPYYPSDISLVEPGPALTVLMNAILHIFAAIHRRHVVHRDIKPQNFMLKDPANPASVHLTDFGMATFVLDASGNHYADSLGHAMIGTPKYASIHVHEGHRYSRRDDLIALAYMHIVLERKYCPWSSDGIDGYAAGKRTVQPTKFLERCLSLGFYDVLSVYSLE
jgi:serine/threonine protein kinase